MAIHALSIRPLALDVLPVATNGKTLVPVDLLDLEEAPGRWNLQSLPVRDWLTGACCSLCGEKKAPVAATILLVDSDLIDRADWQALLQFHGYKVVAVQDGRAALEKLSSVRPDLILIDLGLKDIPGYEVGRRIQKHVGYARTPIVFVGPYFERLRMQSRGGTESGSFKYNGSRDEAFDRVQSILGGSTGLLFENGADSYPMNQSDAESFEESKKDLWRVDLLLEIKHPDS